MNGECRPLSRGYKPLSKPKSSCPHRYRTSTRTWEWIWPVRDGKCVRCGK